MIAVHAGAGFNQHSKKKEYKRVCESACKKALVSLQDGLSAIDIVTEALIVMEDDPLTNAGHGSNYCNDGSIECDASLMDSKTLNWAGIGAIPSIKNPISVARALLKLQEEQHPLGLIPPQLIVSEPARKWAESKGFATADLSTERARSFYLSNKRKLDNLNLMETNVECKMQRLDTVGAVAVDKDGFVAAGVSSGGIAMKFPGRVGQAAAYGAGCWAQQSVAVSTSGNGEYLTKTLFAKECASTLLGSSPESFGQQIDNFFRKNYLESPFLKHVNIPKSAGIIAVVNTPISGCELMWAHTTKTMALASASLLGETKFFLSYLPKDNDVLFQSIKV